MFQCEIYGQNTVGGFVLTLMLCMVFEPIMMCVSPTVHTKIVVLEWRRESLTQWPCTNAVHEKSVLTVIQ